MGEKPRSVFNLVQRMGFFWEYPDSEPLKDIIAGFDKERVKQAAQKTVDLLTDLLECNYSAQGLRLVKVLDLDSLSKIWKYRNYLIKRFKVRVPEQSELPAWIGQENAGDYRIHYLARDFEKAAGRKCFVEGIIVGDNHQYEVIVQNR